MDLFERITKQMLVECEMGNAEYLQAWYRKIPEDYEPINRTEEQQECYDFAFSIIESYLERNPGLRLNRNGECPTATYDFEKDEINCPCRYQFDNDADFYCTIFHELIHSTGVKHRLNRPSFTPDCQRGEYEQEECIAELGAMYLCGICCYNDGKAFDQSSSYIRHYKNTTNSSDEDLWLIARMAARAVNYILGD